MTHSFEISLLILTVCLTFGVHCRSVPLSFSASTRLRRQIGFGQGTSLGLPFVGPIGWGSGFGVGAPGLGGGSGGIPGLGSGGGFPGAGSGGGFPGSGGGSGFSGGEAAGIGGSSPLGGSGFSQPQGAVPGGQGLSPIGPAQTLPPDQSASSAPFGNNGQLGVNSGWGLGVPGAGPIGHQEGFGGDLNSGSFGQGSQTQAGPVGITSGSGFAMPGLASGIANAAAADRAKQAQQQQTSGQGQGQGQEPANPFSRTGSSESRVPPQTRPASQGIGETHVPTSSTGGNPDIPPLPINANGQFPSKRPTSGGGSPASNPFGGHLSPKQGNNPSPFGNAGGADTFDLADAALPIGEENALVSGRADVGDSEADFNGAR